LNSTLFISQCSLVIYIVQNVLIDNIHLIFTKITKISKKCSNAARHRWLLWQSKC